MKTAEVTPDCFAAKFGPNHVVSGPFTYYECENGLGIIKDNARNSISLVQPTDSSITELSEEDEFALLSIVCGEFKPDIIHPANDGLTEYEAREQKSRLTFTASWIAVLVILLACIWLSVMLFDYLQS